MTVRIPIEADAQHVLSVFEQIRTAIRATGQEGTAFQDLDFSHPELNGLENDIRRVQNQFEQLGKIGRGSTAAAVRSIMEKDSNVDQWLRQTESVFPDEGARLRHTATVGNYILQGTQFQQPPAAPPAPPPSRLGPRERMSKFSGDNDEEEDDDGAGGDDGGDDSGGGGGGRGRRSPKRTPRPVDDVLASQVTRFAKFAVGATIGEGVAQGVYHSYEGAKQEDILNDQLTRRVGDAGTSFDELRDKVRGLATAIGVTNNEAQGLSASWARLTNETSSAAVVSGVNFASQFARGYGNDPAGSIDILGRAKYLGENPRDFAVLIADAVQQGGRSGSEEETSRALLRWTENASRTLVTHSNVGEFAALYSAMNRTNLPGLEGQNGEALIGRIDQSIQGGGSAGLPGQALMMRALQRYGISDPYDAQFQLAGGAFEQLGKGGPTNLEAVLAELKREFPHTPRHEFDSILSNIFGIGIRQADAFMTAGSTTDFRALENASRDNGVDLSKVDPGAYPEMERAAAKGADLGLIEKGLRARKDLDPTDIARLDAADKNSDPEALRGAILQTLANRGRTRTTADTIRDGDSGLANTLQDIAGSMVVPLSGVRDNLAKILEPVSIIANKMSASFDDATNPADTSDSQRFAHAMEAMPDMFADAIAAAGGDPAAKRRLQIERSKYDEEMNRFLSLPGAKLGGKGTPELAPDIADDIIKQSNGTLIGAASALALARTEGGGRDLESSAGAWGPMQLMPNTAAEMGVTNIHDPHQNVEGGLKYFLKLLTDDKDYHLHGSFEAAVAAYNAGPFGRGVQHFAATGDPSELPDETKGEVTRARGYRAEYEKRLAAGHGTLIAPGPSAASAQRVEPDAGTVRHEVHVHPVEVVIRHPDGSKQHVIAPVTQVRVPKPSGFSNSATPPPQPATPAAASFAVPAGQHGY